MIGETMARNVSAFTAASPDGYSWLPTRGVKPRRGSSPPARQTPGRGTSMARTKARLDATGAVTRRRSAGPWESVEPRTNWARVDATTEADIQRQAVFDDAEAAKDAAAWVRRVR